MKEQLVKKRGWVKNAAIVFLAVMLALTFFSNTIMNRSLPEVATQSASSGTITAKIRGTGTVQANESYEVILNQTRTVKEVNVRLGNAVETGDVLFTLADFDSKELDAAREALDALLLNYEKAVLTASLNGDYARENRDIQNARDELTGAQAELSAISYSEEAIASAQAAYDSAQATVATREAALKVAQDNLDAIGAPTGGGDFSGLYEAYLTAQANYNSAKLAYDAADIAYKNDYTTFETEALQYARNILNNQGLATWESSTQRATYMAAYAQYLALPGATPSPPTLVAYETMTGLENDRTAAQAALTSAENAYYSAVNSDNTAQYNQLKKKRDDAQAALTSAETTRDAALEALEKQKENKTAWLEANANVKALQKALEDLIFALEELQKTDGVSNSIEALELADMRKQIEKKRSEIAALEADGTGAVISSPVSGVVKQINISSGNQTQSGSPMAVIEVTDRGYSLSFPVTTEQSRKVAVGDAAEVSGWWYGGAINVTLAAIKNDPQNPATSKLLMFDVTGDVESESQLNIAIGQRSASYDVIVPNSALRSDTNGDFVLVVLARSSPLGNRYIATRVDVNILASDDTNSAVSGGLQSWDYVIVTSTKPIEPGMQVRLVDNP